MKMTDTMFIIFLMLVLVTPLSSWAQNCKPESIVGSTSTIRYEDHGNGTVTDKKTGLMWKKCIEGSSGSDCLSGGAVTFTWQNALKRAQTINSNGGFASYTDWRVPNIKELSSIVEEQCNDPATNLAIFPENPPVIFWTSSPHANESNSSWYVDFSNGAGYWGEKNLSNYLRLVRGGQ